MALLAVLAVSAQRATAANVAPSFALPAGSTGPSGLIWTAQAGAGSRNWASIASSADGTKLAGAAQNEQIYTSTDSGVTWTARDASRNWNNIASSSDGTKLVAAVYNGQIYTSTDSGVTWTARENNRKWFSLASSADGSTLVAGVDNGFIYTSTDSGVTWTQRASSLSWQGMATSADGTKMAAAVNEGKVWTSTDSGVTWTERAGAFFGYYRGIASSTDGTKLAAVGTADGSLAVSTDSGVTWTAQLPGRAWKGIASSADGSRLVAVPQNQLIVTSTDYGVTWTERDNNRNWRSVASSADGSKLVAGIEGGQIYTSAGLVSAYDLSLTEDAGAQSVANFATSISAGPTDESAQTVSFTVTNNNNALFSVQPAINAAGTLTFTSATNANGRATVTVIAQDNGGTVNGGVDTSAPQTFTITVTAVNDAPTLAAIGVSGTEDTTLTFTAGNFTGAYSDVENTALASITVATLPATGTLKLSGTAVTVNQVIPAANLANLTYSPSTNENGAKTFTVTASDGSLSSAIATVTMTLAAVNDAPSFALPVGSTDPSGLIWTARESSRTWYAMASSADGTKLAAADSGGLIYTSTDSGVTWTARTGSGSRAWENLASSADGTKLAATVFNGQIYTSTDSGVTWTARESSRKWHGIAASSDGSKLVATAETGFIYTSTDSGTNWTARESSRTWYPIASSTDGTKLVAGEGGGQLYTSTDSGVSWTARDSVRIWYHAASSADGTKLVAVVLNGQIYTSTDSGVTWTARASNQQWISVTSSSDGTKLAATAKNNFVYTSTDSGVTWTARDSTRGWWSIASSADGSKLVAGIEGGQIYTSTGVVSAYDLSLTEDAGAQSVANFATSISAGPVDESAQTVSFTVTNNNNALFSVQPGINAAGTLTFTTAANSNGTATVTIIAQDNGGTASSGVDTSAAQTFTITVTAVNDAPTLAAIGVSGTEDTTLTFTAGNFTGAYSDVENTALSSITVATLPATGTLKLSGTAVTVNQVIPAANLASLTYSPATNEIGAKTFTVTASDGSLSSAAATVTMTLAAVNDPPSFRIPGVTVWTGHPQPGSLYWRAFASSDDGNKLSAAPSGGPIYTSTDAGATWTAQAGSGSRDWISIASSADGTKLVAAVIGQQLYTSTDSGTNWTARENSRQWRHVASSADGTKLVAVFENGPIYTSTDSGATWTAQAGSPNLFWVSVASSLDGTKLVAAPTGGQLYTSTDSGVTWTARDSSRGWYAVASSADGTRLIAAASGGQLYTSTNAGLTWTARESNRDWYSVASSADGNRLVATRFGGPVYTSSDAGVSWLPSGPNQDWYAVASSADGTKLVSGGYPGVIYTGDVADPYTLTATEDSGLFTTNNFVTSISAGPADEAAQTVSFTVTNNNNALFSVQPAINAAGTLTFTSATNANGTATVTVIAQDNGGTANGGTNGSAPQTFTITVTPVNDAPVVAQAIADFAVNEDASNVMTNLTTIFADVETAATSLTYAVVANTNTALVTATITQGTNLTLAFTANSNGTSLVSVSATDPSGLSVTNSFVVTVNAVNDVPSFALRAANTQSLINNGSFETGDFTGWIVSDTVTTSPTVAVRANGMSLGFFTASASDGTKSATHGFSGTVAGTIAISQDVIVPAGGAAALSFTYRLAWSTIGSSASAARTFRMTVQPAGGGAELFTQTVFSASPNTAGFQTTNTPVSVDLSAYVGQSIRVGFITDIPAGDAGNGSFQLDNVRLTATTPDFVVYENSGPTSLANLATNMVTGPANESGETVTFLVSNNNNALFSTQPAIAANGTVTFTPAANANGVATVSAAVRDSGGTANGGVDTSAVQTFKITVLAVNSAPTVTLATNNVVVLEDSGTYGGVLASFSGAPADESGQSVTNVVTSNSNPGLFTVQPSVSTGGLLTFTPAANANGVATVTMVVQDNGGTANGGVDKATNTFTITVLAVTDAPTISLATNNVVRLEDSGAYSASGFATFTAGPANESSQSVTNVTTGNDNAALFSVPPSVALNGTLTFTPAANAFGVATVTVIAQDNGGTADGGADKSTNTFTITVLAVNDAPTFVLRPINTMTDLVSNGSFETSDFTGWIVADTANASPSLAVRANGFNLGFFNTLATDGTKSASHGFSGANAGSISIAQDLTLPTAGSATLTFAYRVGWNTFGSAATSNRTFRVRVQSAGGGSELFSTNLVSVAPNDFSLQVASTPVTLDLTAFAGRSIRLAFVTDIPFGDAGNGSFQLDDVRVVAMTPDLTVFENSGTTSIANFTTNIVTGPVDEVGQTVTFQVGNNHNGLFSSQPSIAANGTLTFTPAANSNGVATVTVIAQDSGTSANGGVDKATNTFTLTVRPAASIMRLTVPANAAYPAGSVLSFTVTFGAVVNVTGTPQLRLNLGSATVNANYASGSGSSNLVFTYTVQVGDTATDGLVIGSPLLLNGGTIREANNADARLTFAPPITAAVVVDTIAPTVTLSDPSLGSASRGPVSYTVSYADANFAASTLTSGNVTLNRTGTANGTVAITGSGATRTVTISSIVGIGTLGISLAAGTASDAAGNLAAAAGPSRTFGVLNYTPQTITFGALTSRTYGDAAITLGATASSSLPVTYAVISGPATVSGSTLTITGAGTVVVQASQAGDGTFSAASTVSQSLTVAKKALTVTAQNATRAYGLANPSFTVTLSGFISGETLANSGVTGTAGLSTTALTTSSPNTFAITPVVGSLSSANYSFNTFTAGTLTITQASATVTLGNLAQTYTGSALAASATTVPAGLTVNLAYNPASPVNVGTYAVTATVADANYQGSATDTLVIGKASQQITFAPPPSLGPLKDLASISLAAAASSGLTVTLTMDAGSPATLNNNAGSYSLSGFGATGTITLRANQAGDANYLAASEVVRTLDVEKNSQIITFGALTGRSFGDAPIALTATSDSALPVSYAVISGPATVSGSLLTLTGAGDVLVRATQAGDTTFNPAAAVDRTFTVGKANQTITFGALTGQTYGVAAITLGATSDSSLTVAYSLVSGPGTVSGNVLTVTGAGTVVIQASQPGNANHSAATPVIQTLTVAKKSLTVTVQNGARFVEAADPAFAVTYAGFAGSDTSARLATPPTVTSAATSGSSAGTYVLSAANGVDDNYAFTYVNGSLVISLNPQAITFGSITARTFGDPPLTLTATASSGLAISYSVVSGPAQISGSEVSVTGVGVVVVRARQVGNTTYAAATPVDQSFTINPPPNTAPTDIAVSSSAVLENRPIGTTVGTLSAADVDNGDMHAFTLVTGTGSTDNAAFTIVGNALRTTAVFDYEAQASYAVRLRATDGGGLFVEKQFTIAVTDVNETPTLAAIANPATIIGNEGVQTISLSGISAGGGETQALTVTATSSNPGLIPNPTVTYNSPIATGSLAYTPVASANGTAMISVTVTDNGGTANGGVNAVTRTFTVTVLGPAEINVTGNGLTIADGDSTPSLADHTDFGRALATSGVVVRTFSIQNLGGADLLLTGTPKVTVSGANAADFTVTQPASAPVTGGGNTTFQVSFTTSVTGLRSATLTIANSDADEGTYDFAIQGTGAGPGNPDAGFNPIANGDIYSSARQTDGKIVIGGAFTTVGGVARNRIARLNVDGTLDAGFNPDASGEIRSVAMQADGRIVVGGLFTTVGGVTRNGIARLNADGTPDPAFAPDANGLVRCVTVQPDGKLVIGGAFTTVGGVPRNRLARLNADGSLDTGFNPDANGEVRSIAMQADGQFVIGGQFTTVSGVTRNNAARINASGTLDAGFNPNVGDAVHSVALQVDGTIVIGGSFTSVGGVTRNRLARINAGGTLDAGFNPDANGEVRNTAVQADGRIVIGGDFTALGAVTRNRLARLNADGTLDAGFDPNVSGPVHGVMLQADGQVVIHGTFTGVGGLTRNQIARLENDVATQSLPVPDYHRVAWMRGGASPETVQVTFELSINGGSTWTSLGTGTRINGGWELNGLTLPGSARVRARARTAGGGGTDSGTLMETVTAFSALSPPVNDAFSGRAVIVGESAMVSGFNVAATREAGEPEHAGLPSDATVWWTWTAPRNGVVTIDTVGTAFDTILAVYRGTAVGTLTLVAANDDAQGTTSAVSFPVTGGTSYQIAVGGLADANGNVTLNLLLPAIPVAPAITSQPVSRVVLDNAGSNVTFSVTSTGAPAPTFAWQKNGLALLGVTNSSFTITNALLADAGGYRVVLMNASGSVTSSVAVLTVLTASANDAFADRFPIVGTTNNLVAQNYNATREAGEPAHAGKDTGGSLWWTWVAPRNGLVRVDTVGSTNAAGEVLNTVLAVYTGNTLNTLTPVTANDDEIPGQLASSAVFFRAAAGVAYQIAVAGFRDANGTVAVGSILLNLAQAPDNDYFANRLAFPAGVPRVRDNNVGTTKEPGERNHAFNAGGKSVWWSWVAPSNGLYRLDTTGSAFDTLLAVYTGSALNALTLIGEHDGDPADNFFVSRVQFQAIGGTEYQFAVDGYQGVSGDVVLNLAAVVPGGVGIAANDNFAQRIAFLGQTNQVTASTVGATKETSELNHGGNAGGHSVWWSWISPISGPVTLSTTNSSFDTTLAVYTGTSLGVLSLVAGNDDLDAAFGVYQSTVTFPAVAGVAYQIAVDGHGSAVGAVVLTLTQPTPEVVGGNDLFANRFLIIGQDKSVIGANTNATKEAGEPKHAGNRGGRSIWWRWVAPASTPVTIDTTGSSFDTLLAVYTGNEVNVLTLVAADHLGSANASTVSFLAVAGLEYEIAVDGNFDGTAPARGAVTLNVRQYPPGALIGNDDFENATPISPQFLTVLGSNLGATRQDGEPAHAGLRQGASAWWTWTALTDGPVTITTEGSEFDTVLSVYAGSSLSSLSLVAENDDPRPGTSRASVSFQAAVGTAYRIAVDGYRGAMGAITLTISPSADVPAAPQLQQLPFAQTRFTAGGGGGTNVAFRVVATGSLPLSYQWLRYGTNLDGATSPVLTLTNASAGDAGTYQVRVSNLYGATNSPGVEFAFVAAPFNDHFANRIAITGTSNSVRGSILEASKEPAEPEHAGVPGGRSVWWKWTAPANGLVEIDTLGSTFDTRLAVYTNTLGSLGVVHENDDMAGGAGLVSRLFFSALAGVEYQIAVDGFKTNGANGAVVLNLHPLDTTQTISFGSLPPKRVGDPAFVLNATTSSGLPVSYASDNPAVATVSGNTTTIIGVGSAIITASQPGDTIFSAANNVVQTLSVGVAPSVTTPPTGLTVNATSNASFTVTAGGTAPLIYQWIREGVQLPGATAATLTLNNVATNQAGNYSVVITNLYGSVTSSVAALTVERLSQTISFAALSPGRTSDAPFVPGATASSGLALSYSSSAPAVATVSGSTVTITGIGSATITATQVGNATFLPAVAVSQTLLVGVAPSVMVSPAALIVNATSNATFNVAADGTLPLSYQWRRDGVDVNQATNATLTLSNVQTNQAGNYSVVITNLYGSVTSSMAALTVDRLMQTITFGSLPSKRLDAGQFALGAIASSGLSASYSSSDSGVAFVSGSSVTLTGIGTATITASQAGSAIYLPAVSVLQALTVTGIPPSVSAPQPASLVINSTSNVTFTVSATGTGPLGYQWFGLTPRSAGATALALTAGGFVFDVAVFDGGRGYLQTPGVRFVGGNGSGAIGTATLSNGVVVAVAISNPGFGYTTPPAVLIDPPSGLLPNQTNASFTLSNVGTNDTGTYFAVVTNAWGSTTSSVATLTVNVPAYITQQASDVVASFGSNVSFTLGVGGTLPMNFQWYWQPAAGRAALAVSDVRNGFVVGTTVLQGGGYYLSPPSVQIIDANGNGATATAVVTAGAVTAVNIVTPGSGYSPNAQIVIAAPSTGVPQLLANQTSATLTLPAVRALDAGGYFAIVVNGGGSVTSTPAILQVQVPQHFAQPPQRLGDGTIRLRFGPQDGRYLLASDLVGLEIWGSTNLADPNAWVRITTGISLLNGQVQVDDADSPGLPRRFYRVIAR